MDGVTRYKAKEITDHLAIENGQITVFYEGHSVARYVRSLAPLTHSLRSFPRGTVENLKYVFTL